MGLIQSPDELYRWLDGKPSEYGRLIALRSALRVLPLVCNAEHYRNGTKNYPMISVAFRAVVIAAAAENLPQSELTMAAGEAARATAKIIGRASGNAATDAAANAVRAAARAAARSNTETRNDAAVAAADSSVYAITRASIKVGANVAVWRALAADCRVVAHSGPKILFSKPLWPLGIPEWMNGELRGMRGALHDEGFRLWLDWYERRLSGQGHGFELSADKDIEMSRLLAAQDDFWWNRNPAEVNAEIQNWIDELNQAESNAEPHQQLQTDPQSSAAPQFRLSPTGRISLDQTAGKESVRKDAAAVNRHAALIIALGALANHFRQSNNAGHLSPIADSLLESLGETIDEIEPSLTVLHAETLRLALSLQQAAGPADDLIPLDGISLITATAAINAANLFIGSDPFLDAKDRLLPGPDLQDPLVAPEAVKAIAIAARDDGVADQSATMALIEAAGNAPSPPSRTSRQSGLLSGMSLNFARYGIEAVLAYPEVAKLATTAGLFASAATFGVVATVGVPATAIASLYGLARFFKANEERLREFAAMSPKTSANFELLMEIVRVLPLKSLKDE